MDSAVLEEMITIGIDIFPSIFRMKSKILGENNENVDYIAGETGAIICLRGKGSGYNAGEGRNDPLHILIKYKDIESKPKARQLILSLIETVQQDFIETYGKYYHRPKKPEICPVFHNLSPYRPKGKNPPPKARAPSPIARPKIGDPMFKKPVPSPAAKPRGPSPMTRPRIPSPIGRPRRPSPNPRMRVSSPVSRIRGPTSVQKPKIPSPVPRRAPLSPVYRLTSLSPPPRVRQMNPSHRLGQKNPSSHWEKRNSISPPIENVGTGVGAINNNIEKMTLGLHHIPLEFNLKAKIYGPDLSNVKHIEKVTGALLLLEGYHPSRPFNRSKESPYLLIKYVKSGYKEKARNLIFNLIETIHDEFKLLFPALSRSVKKPEILPFRDEAGSVISSMTSRITNHDDLISLKQPSWDVSTSAKRSVSPISHKDFSVDITPVPPPPPVISKPISPIVTKPASNRQIAYEEKSPSISISNNRKNIIISPEEISEFLNSMKPALSTVEPVIKDFLVPTPAQPSFTSNKQFIGTGINNNNSIPFITSDNRSTQSLNTQYFKKRSNSPIDKLREPKKFCNATNNNTTTSTFLNSAPVNFITDTTVPPPGWDMPGVEITQTPIVTQPAKINPKAASRCLVEVVPQVNLSAKPQASPQVPFLQQEQMPKVVTPSPTATMQARKLKKISFTINSNAKSNGVLPTPESMDKCSDTEDDGKSVIVIDSEEEAERERLLAESSQNSISASTRTVASQTDVFLFRPYLKCACGRYSHSVNSARSFSTQTNLWG